MITAKQALERSKIASKIARKDKIDIIEKGILEATNEGLRETCFTIGDEKDETVNYYVEQLQAQGFNVSTERWGCDLSHVDITIKW